MTVDGALMQIPYEFKLGTCEGLRQYFDGHGISLEDAKQSLCDCMRPIFPEEWKEKNITTKVSAVSSIFFVDQLNERDYFQKSEFEEYLKFWIDGWTAQQSKNMDSNLALFRPTFITEPGEPPVDGYIYTG